MCAILAAENKRIICYASFKGPCFGEQKNLLKIFRSKSHHRGGLDPGCGFEKDF